jgi:hypothetical protein
MASHYMISIDRVRALLAYDALTGDFSWRVRRGPKAPAGGPAGTPHSGGYLRIKVDHRFYYAHRLAWFYATGDWPADQIDHIDGDKRNNRFANLRLADKAQNSQNAKRRSNNTSGYKGVSWNQNRQCWQVTIKYDGKSRYLGLFDDREQAHAAYMRAAEAHFGEFARAA